MSDNTLDKKANKKILKRIIIVLILIIIIALILLNALNGMVGLTAYSRLEALNSKAKYVYQCADNYILFENIKDDFTITGYDLSEKRITYWAVIIENKKIKYTLFSNNKIDKDEINIPDKETQIKKLSNIFTDSNAIGYYCPNTK
ncbi:MAG TPA: hypothetical protein PKI60_01620 [Oscillospiraceae bacterium]|nr:hypothetical protein [Oscillospiraceae bacterium]